MKLMPSFDLLCLVAVLKLSSCSFVLLSCFPCHISGFIFEDILNVILKSLYSVRSLTLHNLQYDILFEATIPLSYSVIRTAYQKKVSHVSRRFSLIY